MQSYQIHNTIMICLLRYEYLSQQVFYAAHASFLPDEEKKQLLTELERKMKLYTERK